MKTQVSKVVKLGGGFKPLSIKLMNWLVNSLADLFGEKLNNKRLPKFEKDARKLVVNTGLNILDKNVNEGLIHWFWVQE